MCIKNVLFYIYVYTIIGRKDTRWQWLSWQRYLSQQLQVQLFRRFWVQLPLQPNSLNET